MSRSTFAIANGIPTTADCLIHYNLAATNQSHGISSNVIQSSTPKATHKSITRINPKMKRNLRDKRRSTGIHPDEVPIACKSTEVTSFFHE